MFWWRFRVFLPLVPERELLLLLLISGFFPLAWPYHANLCVGDGNLAAGVSEGNAISIGSGANRVFVDSRKLYSAGFMDETKPECFDYNRIHNLTIYPIRYISGDVENSGSNVLFGWFHLHLEADDDGISIIVMQPIVPIIPDPNNNVISYAAGDLVSTNFKKGFCKETMGPGKGTGTGSTGPDLTYREALAPCFFAPNPSTTVPRAFAYAINLNNQENTRLFKARFNFRTDFPECGQMSETMHMEFRAYVSTGVTNMGNCHGPLLIRLNHSKIFFHNKVYGAHDPEPPKGHDGVSCGTELASGNPDWVSGYDVEVPFPMPSLSKECHDNAIAQKGRKFAGRCGKNETGDKSWITSHSNQYVCDLPHPGVVGLKPFKPPFPGGGVNCTDVKWKCEEETNLTTSKGITASSIMGRYVWSFRTTHGIAMSFTTMFVIPFGTMFARFFKETHMTARFINIHVWHGIHIYSALTGFSGLLSGIGAAVMGRLYFGFSWHKVAHYHVNCGWVSIGLFVVSMVTAPFRIYSMGCRSCSICFHFFLASISRILFSICLLTSFYISASPAALHDIELGFTFERDIIIVVVWIVVDIAMHVFLQMQMWSLEQTWPRTYVCFVPIPIVSPTRLEDAPNSSFRNLLVFSHAVFCFACSCLLSHLMCERDAQGRRFGKMVLTHSREGKLNHHLTGIFFDDDE